MNQLLKTALTGPDNETFDIARIAFGAVVLGWFMVLCTFIAIQIFMVFHEHRPTQSFAIDIGALFGTLTVVTPTASWAVRLKSDTEPQRREEKQG